jgi:hypothetical protein
VDDLRNVALSAALPSYILNFGLIGAARRMTERPMRGT